MNTAYNEEGKTLKVKKGKKHDNEARSSCIQVNDQNCRTNKRTKAKKTCTTEWSVKAQYYWSKTQRLN